MLRLLINVILTRGLGSVLYSAFSLSWRLVLTLKEFTFIGADATLIRDGARSNTFRDRSETAGLAYGTSLLGGLILGIFVYNFAPYLNRMTLNTPELLTAFRIAALIMPFGGLILINGFFLRSQEEVERLLLIKDIGWPLVQLVAISFTLFLGYELLGVLGALLLGTVLLGIGGMVYTLRFTKTRFNLPSLSRTLSFYNHAIPSALTQFSIFIRLHIYIFLIGFLVADETAAGIFNVLLVLSQVTVTPLQGFNQLLPPIAAELYGEGKHRNLQKIYSAVTRLITIVTLPLIIYIAIFGHDFLVMFGKQYTVAYTALLIFLGGRLVGNCVGATGWLLLMTDNQYPRLIIDWLLAIFNIPLSYYLVTNFGVLGAALGYSFQQASQNLIQLGFLTYSETLFPFDQTYLKPISAGLIMGSVLLFIPLIVSETFVQISLGGVVGFSIYGIILYLLGFERLDREVGIGLYKQVRELLS